MMDSPSGAIVFRPKQPLVDWLNGLPDAGAPLDLAVVCEDLDGYLVPDFDSPDEPLALVETHAQRFFEHMLFEWCNNREWWPEKRDFEALREWFEIELVGTLVDAQDVISPPSLN